MTTGWGGSTAWGPMTGGTGVPTLLLALLVVLVVTTIVVVGVRSGRAAGGPPPTTPRRGAARELLDGQLARGVVDEDEYQRRLDALADSR